MCTKMLKTLSEKLRAKFPATKPGYSMVKIARLDDAFLEVFKLQASPVKGQSRHSKEKKRRKRKGKKINPKIEKPKDLCHFPKTSKWFLRMPESQRGKTRCWWQERQAAVLQTHFWPGLKLIWPRSSLKTTKMSKKTHFFAKSSRSQWVKLLIWDHPTLS